MNRHALHHEAKSKYAYAIDQDTLHIRLRTGKDDAKQVRLIWGDPFNWRRRSKQEQSKNDEEFSETHVWAHAPEAPMEMHKDYSDADFDYWFIEITPEFKRTRYAFLITENGKDAPSIFYGAHGPVDMNIHSEIIKSLNDYYNFPYINSEDVFKAPDWVKDTVWYQIFPERFANGNPSLDKPDVLSWGSKTSVTNEMHFGGDLEGIIGKLDYIADLGATGIYFTPLFEAPTTHKYDTINYYKIDPEFGDNATFKRLVEEAHKRGIRVMLDAVFNHCGFKHPYFQDVVKNGFSSPYAQCFHLLREPVINFPINDAGFPAPKRHMHAGALNYETFAFTPNMPKWRTSNPVAEAYLMDVAQYWIKEYDIDGWRLDVSNEVSHSFWRKFRKVVKELKPDVFILGENWDDSSPWLGGDQFDSVMNYEFTYPVWHLLSREAEYADYGARAFVNDISKLLVSYPKHVAQNMFNLLDSHDTSRLRTLLSDDDRLVKLAFVLQMSFGGSPSVYYGSEIGLFGVDDGNRQCMIWDEAKQNMDLKAHVKRMIALRSQYPQLKAMDMRWLPSDLDNGIIVYEKSDETGSIRFILNVSNQQQAYKVAESSNSKAFDLIAERELTAEEKIELILPAFGFRILK